MKTNERIVADSIIIGSGIAGLRAARELSERGKHVVLLTKSTLQESNSSYAQGGLSAVDPYKVGEGKDSYESHVQDTLKAGAGLCIEGVVEKFVDRSFEDTIEFLEKEGVIFSQKNEEYVLHQEGGHAHPRIYCVGDYTGKTIQDQLIANVKNDPNITILEHHTGINLITKNQFSSSQEKICLGAYVLNRNSGRVTTILAPSTFLATGGAGRVFQYTSNPDTATGDGVAMAYRVGATIANMEFYQFHPTVLFEKAPEKRDEQRFLLTEALRGQSMGGILTLSKDSLDDFVLNHHPDGSHATRDIVSRAIDTEIKARGIPHVWLNVSTPVTGKSKDYIREHFPKIYAHCLKKGMDISKEPVPVVPAAHYMCGGVLVNEQGQTSIEGLYAIGEVACTGIMGANRLASNSLPEAALYALWAVDHSSQTTRKEDFSFIPEWNAQGKKKEVDPATLNQFWDLTRTTMMTLCGIDRNKERLTAATHILDGLVNAANITYQEYYPTHEIIELRNLTLVGKLIAQSALHRRESRGGHYRSDFPTQDDALKEYTMLNKW